jgi:hypothetical protein
MDWKDVAEKVSGFAPLLGGLLGGPAGATAGSIIASTLGTGATPDAVSQALLTNPDAAVKIKQIESEQAVKLQELAVTAENNRLVAETTAAAAVNMTMQEEAKSDHWPTYGWRPYIGFMFGTYIGSLWLLPLFGKQPITLSADITLAIGGILGVASWFRGKAQADPNIKTDNRG